MNSHEYRAVSKEESRIIKIKYDKNIDRHSNRLMMIMVLGILLQWNFSPLSSQYTTNGTYDGSEALNYNMYRNWAFFLSVESSS